MDLLPAIIPSMAAEYIFDIGNGLLIAQHPATGLIVRSDGAVFIPKRGSHKTVYYWSYGYNTSEGYLDIAYCGKRYLVHRLVAETFIPNPLNKPCVDHKNRQKDWNFVSNLRWCSFKENNSNTKTVLNAVDYGVRKCEDPKEYDRRRQKRLREIYKLNPEWVEKERARNRERMSLKRAKEKGQSCD